MHFPLFPSASLVFALESSNVEASWGYICTAAGSEQTRQGSLSKQSIAYASRAGFLISSSKSVCLESGPIDCSNESWGVAASGPPISEAA